MINVHQINKGDRIRNILGEIGQVVWVQYSRRAGKGRGYRTREQVCVTYSNGVKGIGFAKAFFPILEESRAKRN